MCAYRTSRGDPSNVLTLSMITCSMSVMRNCRWCRKRQWLEWDYTCPHSGTQRSRYRPILRAARRHIFQVPLLLVMSGVAVR